MVQQLILLDGRKEPEYSIRKIYREAKGFFPPITFKYQTEEEIPFDYSILDRARKRGVYINDNKENFDVLDINCLINILHGYKTPKLLAVTEPMRNPYIKKTSFNLEKGYMEYLLVVGHRLGQNVIVSDSDGQLIKRIAHEEAHRNSLEDNHQPGQNINCIMTSGSLNEVDRFCDSCYSKLEKQTIKSLNFRNKISNLRTWLKHIEI